MINEVSEINPIQLSGKSSIYRNVFIKNLSNDIIKVTLWGNQALKFSYEAIYDQKIQHVVVVLFVGCLPKEYKGSVYLSGGAACHWYFNPSINEAQPYYQRDIFHVSKNYTIHNENVTIKLPPLTNEQAAFVSPPETQHKDLKELLESEPLTLPEEGFKCTVTITRLLDDQPWWYKACNTCPNKPSMRSSVSSCPTCGSTDAIIRKRTPNQVSHSFTWKRPILAINQIEHSNASVNSNKTSIENKTGNFTLYGIVQPIYIHFSRGSIVHGNKMMGLVFLILVTMRTNFCLT
ncbi:hypothetical protein ZEAMMB73_Zm00001d031369 [Zea mays]|uniref:Replication factor A C-terminal domain-containing protein n=1 Tax=Zea mays TaxID=4577 RepID=A0A1D6KIG8_MAIZE|nr:hypothetical protein ZEAMMB73_Zm00001d031369 [Zea mays]